MVLSALQSLFLWSYKEKWVWHQLHGQQWLITFAWNSLFFLGGGVKGGVAHIIHYSVPKLHEWTSVNSEQYACFKQKLTAISFLCAINFFCSEVEESVWAVNHTYIKIQSTTQLTKKCYIRTCTQHAYRLSLHSHLCAQTQTLEAKYKLLRADNWCFSVMSGSTWISICKEDHSSKFTYDTNLSQTLVS